MRITLIRIQYSIGIYDNDANDGYLHYTHSDNVLRFVKYNWHIMLTNANSYVISWSDQISIYSKTI